MDQLWESSRVRVHPVFYNTWPFPDEAVFGAVQSGLSTAIWTSRKEGLPSELEKSRPSLGICVRTVRPEAGALAEG